MPAVKSMAKLAQALGVSAVAVTKYVRRPDWPFSPKPPWSEQDVEAIKRWRGLLQENRAGKSAEGATNRRAEIEIRLKTERARTEKLKREILEGEHIRRSLIDGSLGGLASVFLSVCQDIEQTAATRFGNKTPGEIERLIGPLMDSYRQRIIEKAEFELVRVTDLSRRMVQRGRGRPRSGGQK